MILFYSLDSATSNLGKGISRALLSQGYNLVLIDQNQTSLHQIKEELSPTVDIQPDESSHHMIMDMDNGRECDRNNEKEDDDESDKPLISTNTIMNGNLIDLDMITDQDQHKDQDKQILSNLSSSNNNNNNVMMIRKIKKKVQILSCDISKSSSALEILKELKRFGLDDKVQLSMSMIFDFLLFILILVSLSLSLSSFISVD
jgi:NAD(P)-dependent dehydrogenase (short-subunit alcohol dehydrogenase family)